jgi:hypothetical protein
MLVRDVTETWTQFWTQFDAEPIMPKQSEPEIADTSSLKDADWAEINKLKRAHQSGGTKALDLALQELRKDNPERYVRIVAAYFPSRVAEMLKDAMAEAGLTLEDIREMLRRAESPARDQ